MAEDSLSQDPELLKDLMFLTSSQLYEMENSPAGYDMDPSEHEMISNNGINFYCPCYYFK